MALSTANHLAPNWQWPHRRRWGTPLKSASERSHTLPCRSFSRLRAIREGSLLQRAFRLPNRTTCNSLEAHSYLSSLGRMPSWPGGKHSARAFLPRSRHYRAVSMPHVRLPLLPPSPTPSLFPSTFLCLPVPLLPGLSIFLTATSTPLLPTATPQKCSLARVPSQPGAHKGCSLDAPFHCFLEKQKAKCDGRRTRLI